MSIWFAWTLIEIHALGIVNLVLAMSVYMRDALLERNTIDIRMVDWQDRLRLLELGNYLVRSTWSRFGWLKHWLTDCLRHNWLRYLFGLDRLFLLFWVQHCCLFLNFLLVCLFGLSRLDWSSISPLFLM